MCCLKITMHCILMPIGNRNSIYMYISHTDTFINKYPYAIEHGVTERCFYNGQVGKKVRCWDYCKMIFLCLRLNLATVLSNDYSCY